MEFIKLRGVLVDIICKISSDYKAYVTRDKRRVNQLLLRLHNALYEKMVDSLLYYCKFTKSIASIGFDINPYDPCVANKAIDGSHMKIWFYVDYCKLSNRGHHTWAPSYQWVCTDQSQRSGMGVQTNWNFRQTNWNFMVVYTLLKKHAFAVLKCKKNGPSDQSEMIQDQSWPQGAHVWWEQGQGLYDQVDPLRVWKYLWGWVREDVNETRQGSYVPSDETIKKCSWSSEDHNAELPWGDTYRLQQRRSEREGQKVKRHPQQHFVIN